MESFDLTQRVDFLLSDDEESNSTSAPPLVEAGHLEVIDEHIRAEFPLYQGINTIGRKEDCTVVLNKKGISKKHAVIEIEKDVSLLYDLGSSNKTRKGKMILKPNVRYSIQDKETLFFSNVKSLFKLKQQIVDSDTGSMSSEPMFPMASSTVSAGSNINNTMEQPQTGKIELALPPRDSGDETPSECEFQTVSHGRDRNLRSAQHHESLTTPAKGSKTVLSTSHFNASDIDSDEDLLAVRAENPSTNVPKDTKWFSASKCSPNLSLKELLANTSNLNSARLPPNELETDSDEDLLAVRPEIKESQSGPPNLANHLKVPRASQPNDDADLLSVNNESLQKGSEEFKTLFPGDANYHSANVNLPAFEYETNLHSANVNLPALESETDSDDNLLSIRKMAEDTDTLLEASKNISPLAKSNKTQTDESNHTKINDIDTDIESNEDLLAVRKLALKPNLELTNSNKRACLQSALTDLKKTVFTSDDDDTAPDNEWLAMKKVPSTPNLERTNSTEGPPSKNALMDSKNNKTEGLKIVSEVLSLNQPNKILSQEVNRPQDASVSKSTSGEGRPGKSCLESIDNLSKTICLKETINTLNLQKSGKDNNGVNSDDDSSNAATQAYIKKLNYSVGETSEDLTEKNKATRKPSFESTDNIFKASNSKEIIDASNGGPNRKAVSSDDEFLNAETQAYVSNTVTKKKPKATQNTDVLNAATQPFRQCSDSESDDDVLFKSQTLKPKRTVPEVFLHAATQPYGLSLESDSAEESCLSKNFLNAETEEIDLSIDKKKPKISRLRRRRDNQTDFKNVKTGVTEVFLKVETQAYSESFEENIDVDKDFLLAETQEIEVSDISKNKSLIRLLSSKGAKSLKDSTVVNLETCSKVVNHVDIEKAKGSITESEELDIITQPIINYSDFDDNGEFDLVSQPKGSCSARIFEAETEQMEFRLSSSITEKLCTPQNSNKKRFLDTPKSTVKKLNESDILCPASQPWDDTLTNSVNHGNTNVSVIEETPPSYRLNRSNNEPNHSPDICNETFLDVSSDHNKEVHSDLASTSKDEINEDLTMENSKKSVEEVLGSTSVKDSKNSKKNLEETIDIISDNKENVLESDIFNSEVKSSSSLKQENNIAKGDEAHRKIEVKNKDCGKTVLTVENSRRSTRAVKKKVIFSPTLDTKKRRRKNSLGVKKSLQSDLTISTDETDSTESCAPNMPRMKPKSSLGIFIDETSSSDSFLSSDGTMSDSDTNETDTGSSKHTASGIPSTPSVSGMINRPKVIVTPSSVVENNSSVKPGPKSRKLSNDSTKFSSNSTVILGLQADKNTTEMKQSVNMVNELCAPGSSSFVLEVRKDPKPQSPIPISIESKSWLEMTPLREDAIKQQNTDQTNQNCEFILVNSVNKRSDTVKDDSPLIALERNLPNKDPSARDNTEKLDSNETENKIIKLNDTDFRNLSSAVEMVESTDDPKSSLLKSKKLTKSKFLVCEDETLEQIGPVVTKSLEIDQLGSRNPNSRPTVEISLPSTSKEDDPKPPKRELPAHTKKLKQSKIFSSEDEAVYEIVTVLDKSPVKLSRLDCSKLCSVVNESSKLDDLGSRYSSVTVETSFPSTSKDDDLTKPSKRGRPPLKTKKLEKSQILISEDEILPVLDKSLTKLSSLDNPKLNFTDTINKPKLVADKSKPSKDILPVKTRRLKRNNNAACEDETEISSLNTEKTMEAAYLDSIATSNSEKAFLESNSTFNTEKTVEMWTNSTASQEKNAISVKIGNKTSNVKHTSTNTDLSIGKRRNTRKTNMKTGNSKPESSIDAPGMSHCAVLDLKSVNIDETVKKSHKSTSSTLSTVDKLKDIEVIKPPKTKATNNKKPETIDDTEHVFRNPHNSVFKNLSDNSKSSRSTRGRKKAQDVDTIDNVLESSLCSTISSLGDSSVSESEHILGFTTNSDKMLCSTRVKKSTQGRKGAQDTDSTLEVSVVSSRTSRKRGANENAVSIAEESDSSTTILSRSVSSRSRQAPSSMSSIDSLKSLKEPTSKGKKNKPSSWTLVNKDDTPTKVRESRSRSSTKDTNKLKTNTKRSAKLKVGNAANSSNEKIAPISIKRMCTSEDSIPLKKAEDRNLESSLMPRMKALRKQSSVSKKAQSPNVKTSENPMDYTDNSDSSPVQKLPKRKSLSVDRSLEVFKTPNSMNKRTKIEHHVMLTGITEIDAQKFKSELNITEDVRKCTVVVMEKFKRTAKALCCIAQGIPIVHTSWLVHSLKEKKIVDFDEHKMIDTVAEKQFDFKLQDTIHKSSQDPLLKSWKIHATENVLPSPQQMEEIVQCAGGTYLKRIPTRFSEKTVVITTGQDASKVQRMYKLGIPVVKTDFILLGILQHKLDVDKHRFSS